MTLALVTALLAVLMVIGVPIGFALGITTLGYMWLGGISPLLLAQQMIGGTDSWTLLAMPLFVVAGLLMNSAGISDRIIGLANALVGHFRGGLAMVNVVDSMLFGGISGSAVADTAALGTIIIPAMRKEGYPDNFSAALTSSTASIGSRAVARVSVHCIGPRYPIRPETERMNVLRSSSGSVATFR